MCHIIGEIYSINLGVNFLEERSLSFDRGVIGFAPYNSAKSTISATSTNELPPINVWKPFCTSIERQIVRLFGFHDVLLTKENAVVGGE